MVFEILLVKDLYNSISLKTKIINFFRTRSFVLYGSLKNWNMTIIGKKIRE